MTILEGLPEQQPAPATLQDQQPNTNRVTIIDGMAIVQSMGKPTWVRTGLDLAKHFMTIVETNPQTLMKSTSYLTDMMFQIR